MSEENQGPGVRLPDVAREAGVSYRQADYWWRLGLIPGLEEDERHVGSGFFRRLPEGTLEWMAMMGALTAAGMGPSLAARLIKDGQIALRDGTYVVVVSNEPGE